MAIESVECVLWVSFVERLSMSLIRGGMFVCLQQNQALREDRKQREALREEERKRELEQEKLKQEREVRERMG